MLLLAHEKSILSLRIQHSIAFNVRKVTHVALLSERIVMITASLAGPVTHGFLLVDTVLLGHPVVKLLVKLWSWLVLAVLSSKLGFGLLVFHLSDVFWLALVIFCVTDFFAAEALGTSLEVVVVAHAAFPSTVWEGEFFRVLFLGFFLLLWVLSFII